MDENFPNMKENVCLQCKTQTTTLAWIATLSEKENI